MQFPYLILIVVFMVMPILLLWVIFGALLKKHLRFFIAIGILAFAWGFLFDILGSNIWNIWFYQHTLGGSLLNLPLEEYLTLLLFPHEVIAILLVVREKIHA